ncbi:MAG: hypothetical protein ACI81W_000273 [Saprospiraceae bacterium]|jgi:hypothetical protein
MVSIITSLNFSVQNIFTKTIEKLHMRKPILSIFAIAVFLLGANIGFSQTSIMCTVGSAIGNTSDDGTGNCSTTVLGIGLLADVSPGPAAAPGDYAAGTGIGQASVSYTLTGATILPSTPGTDAGINLFLEGVTIVTYTVTDLMDASTASCVVNVTITDDEDPVITCPGNMAGLSVDLGFCYATVGGLDPIPLMIPDNCAGPVTLDYVLTGATGGAGVGSVSGFTFNVGTTTVTYTATDVEGNTDICAFTIEVIDDEDPMITTCPGTITVEGCTTADILNGGFTFLPFSAVTTPITGIEFTTEGGVTTDNCNIASITYIDAAAGTCPIVVSRTYIVTDDDANSVLCVQTINIDDTTVPTIGTAASSMTVECDGTPDPGGAFAAWLASNAGAAATDNCSGVIWSNNSTGLSDLCGATGAEIVTFTATDDCLNTSTTIATFTIEDTTDPVWAVAPSDMTVECDGAGNAAAFAAWLTSFSGTDVCGTAAVTNNSTGLSDLCGATGAETVTFTLTDECLNDITMDATFTIEDTTDPVWAVAPSDMTVECDGAGNAAAFAAWLTSFSGTDVCGTAAVTNNSTGLSDLCGATGAETVTFTLTDECLNDITMDATFTIEDTTDPVWAVAPSDMTVECDGAGNAAAFAAWLTSFSGTDVCGTAAVTNNSTGLSDLCGATGAETVTFTLTDECLNDITMDATFTIEDTTDPVWAVAPSDMTVECDGAGNAAAFAAWLTSFSGTDVCGTAAVTNNSTGLSDLCGATGAETVTFTLTDECLNDITMDATFTIEDTTDPVWAVAPSDMTVECDGAGNAAAFAAWLISFSGTDVCGTAAVTNNSTGLSDLCGATGAETVTFTLTDECLNDITMDATFTIEDTTPPSFGSVPADITINTSDGGTGDCEGQLNWNHPTISDVCGPVVAYTVEYADDPGNLINITSGGAAARNFPQGATLVTYRSTDDCGNIGTSTFTATIEDDEAPVAVCQDITVSLDGSGNATIIAGDIDNGSTDNCISLSLSLDITTFDCTDLGANTVTLTVTDGNSNTNTCTATVTVEDNTDPVLTTPADFSQSVDPGQCDAVVTFATSATDNCDASVNIVCVPSSGSTFPVGPTTVTCTATDDAGNTDVSAFVVTILENEAPVAVCQDITVQLDASGTVSITAGQIDNGSTDNCGISTMTVSPNTFTCADAETTVSVTLTVTDINGNVGTCTANVTVEDNIPPTITCPADIIQSADPGDCEAVVIIPLPVTDDNCPGGVTITNNSLYATSGGADASGTYPVGTHTFTYTINDGNGNSTTCSMNVTIDDDELPVITCPVDITVSAGASCDATIDFSGDQATATDNCGVTIANDYNGGGADASDTYPLGTTMVTFTATDPSGNTSSCNTFITVEDNTAPTQTGGQANGSTISEPAGGGGCTAIVNWTAPTFTDNCLGVVVPTTTHTPGSTFSVGTHTVVYTATDPSGNTTTVSFTVIVTDGVAPIAGCQPVPINLFLVGSTVTLDALDVNLGSFDNCGIFSYEISTDGVNFSPSITFDCNDLVNSPFTITLRVSDGVLTDDCTSTVTLSDNIFPSAVCQNISVNLDANGDATITAAQINNGSSDNTGCFNLALNTTSFDCSDIGPNTVTLIVSDFAGNTSSCNATVTVVDNIAPIFNPLTVPGNITIACSDAIPGDPGTVTATDNCDTPVIIFGQTSTQSGNVNNCSNYSYSITQTWTASDNSSNSSSVSRVITVVDNVAPTNPVFVDNIPVNDTISTDPTTCTATVSLSVTAYTDCAPFANLTITNNSAFAVSGGADASGDYPIGFHAVQFIATDPCGNSSNWTVTFTVLDLVAPTASCISTLNLGLPSSGILVLPPSAVNSGSFDNCGVIDSMAINPNTFTCADVGNTIPVTLRVWDDAGNSSTCNTSVTIQENNAPTAICLSITVTLDSNGEANISADDINNGSFDDCTGVTLSISQTLFTDADLGNNTVTLTVTDLQTPANSSSCNATVTVILPPTCFDMPTNLSGGAGDIVQIPVFAEDFINLISFQFEVGLSHPDAGEFIGVSNIHPDLNNFLLGTVVQTDSSILSIDTTFVPDINGMDSIAAIDTSYTPLFDNISVTWLQNDQDAMTNELIPISLNTDDTLFTFDLMLTGDIGDFSFIDLNAGSGTTIPQIVYSFDNNFYPVVSPLFNCVNSGFVQIGQLLISGEIYTETPEQVALVDVDLIAFGTNTSEDDDQTEVDGLYEVVSTLSGSYVIRPTKTINWSNGIDVLDVGLIQRHSVGNPYVSSAYKKIAADVSGNGDITTFDAVLLNAYIASFFNSAQQPSTPSWQFVDAKQMLPNDQNAFVPAFRDTIILPSISSDSLGNDFVAVKTGDIGGLQTADVTMFGEGPDDRADDVLSFLLKDRKIVKGETVSLDFTTENFEQMMAYQWILKFNPTVLRYTGFDKVNLPNLGNMGFSEARINEGELILTWFAGEDITKAIEDVVFSLNFEVLENAGQISDLFNVQAYDIFSAVAYRGDQTPMEIELVFTEPTAKASAFILNQNTPNPFKDETVISFTLPETTDATLTIMDIAGHVLKQYKGTYTQGYNEISINRSELSDSGILFYELKTPNDTASRKMIIID